MIRGSKHSWIGLTALLACSAALAAPLTPDGAFLAARSWHGGFTRHMGKNVGTPTGRLRTFAEGGTNLFHLVELNGGGFVAVAADDSRRPVMAFSPSGDLPTEDDGGPLWTLLAAGGAAAVGHPPRRRSRRRLSMRENQASSHVRQSGATRLMASSSKLTSVSDVRVAPLVKSKWDQKRAGGKNTYNYYTTNHWYCGCVATAMAQLMRYHCHPATAVQAQTFTCYVKSTPVPLTMIGGVYNWDLMPLVPDASISDAEREMIGRLCYDAGVSVRMMYDSGGSGALGCFAHDPLTSVFGYACAQSYLSDTTLSESEIENAILANLDAGFPVMLGIRAPSSSGQDAGHAILADGYGYEDDSLWCHLNMGWSGSSDLWYALPRIPAGGYTFTIVECVVYNVFPTGTGELVTGRVTDVDGNPLEGATVSATYTTMNKTTRLDTTTAATGIYAFRLPAPRFGSRSVTVSATYGAAKSGSATTSISSSSSPYNIDWDTGNYYYSSGGLVIGNSWGNDLAVVPAAGEPPSVATFSAAATMAGSDFSLSFSGTAGAKYEVQYSPTLAPPAWVTCTNLLLGIDGEAALNLSGGDNDAGFWRIVPK